MREARIGTMLLAAGLAMGTLAMAGAQAQAPPAPEEREAAEAAPMLDPKTIWPAGLEKLAGRYVFYQVASPGGLWETFTPKNGRSIRRQVSINQLPAAFRDRLTRAEVVISDIKMPVIEASERLSPSKRGMLRFYSERAEGRLNIRGLPGIGGNADDAGAFSGPVLFRLDHGSHSNPSVVGILQQRMHQEQTWGAATLDYADLVAMPVPVEAPANGDKPRPQKAPVKPKPGDAEAADDAGDPVPVMVNARTLRSGIEIFSFVEWRQKGKDGDRHYTGSVRMIRDDLVPKEPMLLDRPRTMRI